MDEIKDEIIVGNPTETLLDEQNDVVNNIGTDADVCDIENDVENAQEVNKENEENVETAQSDEEEESVEERTSRTLSPGRIVLKRFFRSKLSITGLVMLIVLFVFSFIGPLFSNLPFIWGEREADDSKKVKETYYTEVSAPDFGEDTVYIVTYSEPTNYLKPSKDHLLGTDDKGFDVFSRLMYGGRVSLTVGFVVIILETIIGVFLGGLAGYFGKWVDQIIMRSLDIFMSIPDLLFTMVVVAALGSSIPVLIIAMTLAYFTNYVRLVRSGVLNLVDQEYVEAARAGGASPARIILSHIIPNTLGIILVNVTLNVSSLVIYQSTLSFIGLSLPAPAPEWGSMLSSARVDMLRAPTLVLFPALAIVLTAFSVNLLGDGLRDAMDPRLKS